MNYALAQPARLFSHRRVLSGGHAPAHWKGDLSRATRELGTLFRSCEWLNSVVEPYRGFFEQPLFGHCLTELTSAFAASADETSRQPQEHAQPKSPGLRQKPAKPKPFERSVVLSSRASPLPQPQGAVPGNARTSPASQLAPKLPRRVDHAVLQRLAGAGFNRERIEAKLPKQISPPPLRGSESLSAKAAASVPTRPWHRLVAARAANAWLKQRLTSSPVIAPHSLDTSVKNQLAGTVSEGISTQHGVATVLPTRRASDVSAMFEQQWTTRVDGIQAGPQILVNLINGSKEQPSSPARRAPSDLANPSSPPSPSVTREQSIPPSPKEGRRHSFDVLETTADVQRRSFESVSELERDLGARPQIAPNFELDNSQPFTAPVLTPSLPPLLPSVSSGAAARPIAVDTARQISWRDEVYAQEDDLSVLASQIKRILDEEARRHGIDI